MMTSPLIELYAAADQDVRKRGRLWYPETRRRLRALAQEYDRPLSQVVAVFAITSVAAQLAANLRWTEEILQGLRTGGRYPNVQGPLVEAALHSTRPGRYARGPKVSTFYRALMGDRDAVVIDRWAARAAGWESEKHAIPVRVQRQMIEAYMEAAKTCRESPRDFQAVVWIVKRETTPKSNGVLPNLWDVTRSQNPEIGG